MDEEEDNKRKTEERLAERRETYNHMAPPLCLSEIKKKDKMIQKRPYRSKKDDQSYNEVRNTYKIFMIDCRKRR